jgi:pectinesterase inhibitor-like protein
MVHFLSIMVVFLSCVASSYATNVVDVQEICKKATNPSFCSTLLKSRPGGPGEDLVSLASYTIDVLHTNVSNTINLMTKLVEQSGNDSMKQNRYKNCLSRMDDGALDEVVEAQKVLKDSDYNGVNMHITSVMTAVDECLSKDSSPDNDTSLLPKHVECVNQVAQIVLIISNVLLN